MQCLEVLYRGRPTQVKLVLARAFVPGPATLSLHDMSEAMLDPGTLAQPLATGRARQQLAQALL